MYLKKLRYFSENIILYSIEWRKSYRFGTKWEWVNNDMIFILMWTIPLYFLTLLFSFYFYISLYLFPQFKKNAFNVWKYTSNNDQKKCTTAIRSEKMSVIPVIPLWHLAHISHGCQHFRRAMFFPGVPFHPPHICLTLLSFSLYRSNPSKEIPFFKGRITFRNVWSHKTNQKRNFHWIFKTRR